MTDTAFFARGEGLSLADLATLCGGRLTVADAGADRVTGLAALGTAGPDDLSFFDSVGYTQDLAQTRAGCVLLSERYLPLLAAGTVGLVVSDPSNAFAVAGQALYPGALRPTPSTGIEGISPAAHVDRSAVLEADVTVEAGAVIGPGVAVGRGTVVGAGAVIAQGCRIGRDCRIGPQVTVTCALIGNGVILHPGVRIGQDGFGYAAGRKGITKIVQIGRVIVQDGVEIGANSTIDRGGVRDTVIGENTKIDNQVQIGHNVRIGRNCLIVAQVGIAGSATLGDGVMIGGQSGVNGHVTIGDGAQIAAVSTVAGDVPPRARWGGTPARPVREWLREVTYLRELMKTKRGAGEANERSDEDA
ncbi:UDP-3-O-(3-hydroxymyristoyl)glucosamine N-acyltransferase [Mangrovibrevibacter kandeliae]|uniref:UDP-3-O-(3-hydroxymyristoyl)glucosamine N-acyltransferase n=1 Tax=Mangrovibrevibacter kandeliae TaxID=2968473 RepID=UPI002118D0F4|nr:MULTISPECIES: UDP-3-O-(3-hydroxymyristoyl)glucosamine N-acyltransferase [unclassified Aurantimonas]MCQ8782573.1 UDP-3-O-(3-hydroxymyristoyl)glucosamine N-acyltransferase [Aurantimonas sp. CSK15Z-1]MCW4114618.1 UDP-3-O-(3-hydroxymyristoyl)glucosamine N-acyltransferase [Aurantimonas sp. MSK8Z-1]